MNGSAVTLPATGDASHDLVVIVPGIMGSELVEVATGVTLWGLQDLRWYVRAWSTGSGLAALRLTDDERSGRYDRVKPVGLLRFPAFARVFAGFEPYSKLVQAARAAVVVPDAQVVEFPYDWRLPVAHNARLLAACVAARLERWRGDARHDQARRVLGSERPAKVVVVAHSMGGLLARCLSLIPGATDDVRAALTLGTPFYGSVKAAMLFNTGRGVPLLLPARRPMARLGQAQADEGVRALAATLPGVHDLLPTYRCLHSGPSEPGPGRRLTVDDAVALGADAELAAAAEKLHGDLDRAMLPNHRCLVGTAQPTPQSLTLAGGIVEIHCGLWTDDVRWVDRGGDGTVYRDAAGLPSAGPALTYLPQQHGALARSDEACALVRDVITEQDPDRLGPPLAAVGLGMDLPDLAEFGEEVTAVITGIGRPRDATCRVTDPATGRTLAVARIEARDGRLCAVFTVDKPGIYRVEVDGGGYSPVQQLVLVTATPLDEPSGP